MKDNRKNPTGCRAEDPAAVGRRKVSVCEGAVGS